MPGRSDSVNYILLKYFKVLNFKVYFIQQRRSPISAPPTLKVVAAMAISKFIYRKKNHKS